VCDGEWREERRKTKGRREGTKWRGSGTVLLAGIEVKRGRRKKKRRREGEIMQMKGREVLIHEWGKKGEDRVPLSQLFTMSHSRVLTAMWLERKGEMRRKGKERERDGVRLLE
jgi:hypothetical protein